MATPAPEYIPLCHPEGLDNSLSQHIAALEADLGVSLLSRRPVAPTEAGVRLLEHGGAILLRLDAGDEPVPDAFAGFGPVAL